MHKQIDSQRERQIDKKIDGQKNICKKDKYAIIQMNRQKDGEIDR